jgi:hypothetical protein
LPRAAFNSKKTAIFIEKDHRQTVTSTSEKFQEISSKGNVTNLTIAGSLVTLTFEIDKLLARITSLNK